MSEIGLWARHSAAQAANLFDEIIVDSFAGGGGASMGIEAALRRAVDVAINHDPEAIAMHSANHPHTMHLTEDVWQVNPMEATGGRPVGLLWASPDCKHFSRAKGGKPVEKKIRSLAWVVVKWAKLARPRIIILENVREFQDWGPLVQATGTDGKPLTTSHGEPVMVPDKTRKGQTFKRWVSCLRNLGYAVEWRPLNAADYGAPTHRRRLFLIARRDGRPIVWPEPTHGPGRGKPYRTAAECIDWSIPCPSIFNRKRPLAEKTMRRIAMGIKRFVLDNPKPFVVRLAHGDGHGATARWGHNSHSADEPLPTVTGSKEYALVSPLLARTSSKGWDKEAGGVKPAGEPVQTILPKDGMAVVTLVLVECANSNWGNGARPANQPGPTITAMTKGGTWALCQAFLAKHYGGVVGQVVDKPLGTVTAVDHHSLVAAHITKLYGTSTGSDPAEPMPTTTAGGLHAGLVHAFLIRYFGQAIGQGVDEPKFTSTCKDRDGLVIVHVAGEPHVIVDVGLRMLTPRELAKAQGFPDDYVLTGTKSSQVARIGNSVCPVMSEVLVRANCSDMAAARPQARRSRLAPSPLPSDAK